MLKNNLIAPSVLSMDFSDAKQALEQLHDSMATWLHFDVMDGHFVPNISFGPSILKDLKSRSPLFMDVHLMIDDPVGYADVFIKAGADLITFHWECFKDIERATSFVEYLHAKGVKAGVTSKPATNIKEYKDLFSLVDLVLVMSVEPGFGGQAFMPEALDKIHYLDHLREQKGYSYLIEVDGGINADTGKLCVDAGCDVLVAGSYVFKGNIKEKVKSLCF